MATIKNIETGLIEYIEKDFLPKILIATEKNKQGLVKWGVSSAVLILAKKAENIFEIIEQNKMLKTLGIIDEVGDIDIDMLYETLIEVSEKGNATQEIPFLGSYTFDADDINKLFKRIEAATKE